MRNFTELRLYGKDLLHRLGHPDAPKESAFKDSLLLEAALRRGFCFYDLESVAIGSEGFNDYDEKKEKIKKDIVGVIPGLRKEGKFPNYNRGLLTEEYWIKLLTEPSKEGTVLIVPDFLYLPRSNNATYEEQLEMVGGELNNRLPYVLRDYKAVMGTPMDWTQIIIKHYEETRKKFKRGEVLFSNTLENQPVFRNRPAIRTSFDTRPGWRSTIETTGTRPLVDEVSEDDRNPRLFAGVMFVKKSQLAA